MEIKQLKALAAIAETGSFGAAAERLHLTQSAISHQIRHLEEELGETLLVRGKPRVTPSAAGRSVLQSSALILAEMDAIRDRFVSQDPSDVVGEITVSATSVGMTYLYGELCEGFMRRYPKVKLIFRSADTAEEAARSIEKGAADAGFVPLVHEHPSLHVLPLGRTEDALIVGRRHPLFKQRDISLTEILKWPFVRFQHGSGSRAQSDRLFSEVGYPAVAAESNEMEFVKRIVGMGIATAIIPIMAVRPEVKRGQLKALRVKGRPMVVDFGLVHAHGTRMRTLELLKAYCLEVRGPTVRSLSVDSIAQPFFRTD